MERTRLSIPVLIHEEACSGYLTKGATIFPQAIGLAASFDPGLVNEMAAIIRAQMMALGARQALAPLLDVTRDPRWGRTEETFGEDPYLVSRMGAAFVGGLQGESLRAGVIATGKHFAGYGCPEGGMNWAPARIPPRELLDTYLFPFEVAVRQAKLQSIMPAYNELDGIPCHSNEKMISGILRDRWGFGGIVVSDYFGIDTLREHHRSAPDKAAAAVQALEAGIDVELPSVDCYGAGLEGAISVGAARGDLIDAAVSRVLRKKFELGLFDEPYVDESLAMSRLRRPEQGKVALRAALESIILLKNDGVLPLGAGARRLAVIGPNANEIRNMLGDYTFPAHIESLLDMAKDNFGNTPLPDNISALRIELPPMESVLAGIRKASPQTELLYAKGCEVIGGDRGGFAAAIEAASRSDAVVAVMGDKSGLIEECTSGEARDRSSLELPGLQRELLEALARVGKPLVLIIISGRPLSLQWEDRHASAIMYAWLPGKAGGEAIASVLFGAVSPAGRAPISFPRTVGQVPVFYAHKPSGGRSHWKGDYVDGPTSPLYPFGHGLSYSRFSYSEFAAPPFIEIRQDFEISFILENEGASASDEVPQLYVHRAAAGITVPIRELIGFVRLPLDAGGRKKIVFRLSTEQLGHYDHDFDYVVTPGEVEFFIGASSGDIRLSGSSRLKGEGWKPDRSRYETLVFFMDL